MLEWLTEMCAISMAEVCALGVVCSSLITLMMIVLLGGSDMMSWAA